MKKGEISWFKFTPEYHYGKHGVPDADPPIPPNTDIYYKVTLFDYKLRVVKSNKSRQLLLHENFPKLDKLLKEGNEFYQEDLLEDAYYRYLKGYNIVKCLPKL